MAKVFLIGRRRTGIKSIVKALKVIGVEGSTILEKSSAKKVEGIIEEMDSKDVCAVVFDYTLNDIRAIEAAYPASTFVLSEREPDSWYSSWLRFYNGKKGHENKVAYSSKSHIVSTYYIKYNQDVKTHFQGREWKLLQFYYGKNASWQTICAYFKKEVPNEPFPHENRAK
jgi:hypothetical protein